MAVEVVGAGDFFAQPHLLSPVTLLRADMGPKAMTPPHIMAMDRHVRTTLLTENGRGIINIPFQHAKSVTCSVYSVAWRLLTAPETRCGLCTYSDTFAAQFGGKVRDVIEKWGGALGIRLRKDTKAKDEWVIAKHGGGLVCRGRGGSFTGRAIDCLFLDDLLKDAEEAMSAAVLESMWDWYCTVAYSRLGPTAPIMSVGTRWGKRDWFGRIKEEQARTGEPWQWLILPAIAEENDPLGRKVGEALWPERVPLSRLQMLQKERGRWFTICWQQKDSEAEDGTWLRPKQWPRYEDLGNVYVIHRPGMARRLVQKNDCIVLFANDWAYSVRRKGDSSGFVFGVMTPPYVIGEESDVDILIVEARRVKVKPEQLAPECDHLCEKWRPRLGAVEEGHPTLKDDVRRFPNIPTIQWMKPQGKDKLQRAFDAIIAGERGRILLPVPDPGSGLEAPWVPDYIKQLAGFTGIDDGPDTDDLVDATSWLAKLVRQYRPAPKAKPVADSRWLDGPLTPMRDTFGWR